MQRQLVSAIGIGIDLDHLLVGIACGFDFDSLSELFTGP